MTEFLERLATLVINSDGYKEESGHLFGAYVEGLSGPSDKFERKQVKKLITSAHPKVFVGRPFYGSRRNYFGANVGR